MRNAQGEDFRPFLFVNLTLGAAMSHFYPGPSLPLSQELHATKHRASGQSFNEAVHAIADRLKDGDEHFKEVRDIIGNQRFLMAGRIQSAFSSSRLVTANNCFVSGTIEDSMTSIGTKALESWETMRRGGGIGYDFSRLRPAGAHITTLDSEASGPVSFMGIFDAGCKTIRSAGHRRGAQMGILRVDHPDIETFIHAKQEPGYLTQFNLSVGVTDEFMVAVREGIEFSLRFEDTVYKRVDARALFDEIMRMTWMNAEPGVIFLDTINRMNNLYYSETPLSVRLRP